MGVEEITYKFGWLRGIGNSLKGKERLIAEA
jgi:hypothetical protein